VRIAQTFLLLPGLFLVQESLALGVDRSLLEVPIEVHNGEAVKLKDLVGEKPIYLKFWASWCVPCREQMPHLENIYQDYNGDLEIVSVNIWINESEEALEATKKEFGLTVPIAIDRRGELAQAFDFIGTPYHVLIDRDGDIVHTGHEADAEFDQKIELLAARAKSSLPKIALTPTGAMTVNIAEKSEGVSVLFFSATWCDWYLKESRPLMSAACIQAQQNMNEVHNLYPDINMLGVVSRLWTGETELHEYVEKYAITHPIAIDESNDAFFALNVRTVPVIVVMKDGEEVLRTSKLDSVREIAETIQRAAH